MDTPEDFEFLKSLEETDPDFVNAYLGGIKPQMSNTDEKLLTIRNCAEVMGFCENTILNHIRAGKLKAELIDNRWLIRSGDFESYQSSIVVKKGRNGRSLITFNKRLKKKKPIKEENMNGNIVYEKLTSRTLADFLHTWQRNRSPGFSLPTICRDFNQVAQLPASERQMSGILSSLKKKGIVIRKGKGIYQVSPSIVGESVQENSQQHAPEAPTATNDEWVVVDADIEQTQASYKKHERLAVEAFIKNYADPEKDFIFTISQVSREYPHLKRVKIGKACNNMCHNGKLHKGKVSGEYIRLASVVSRFPTIISPPKTTSSTVLDEINQIMNSSMAADLKEKLIKSLMGA